MFAIVLQGCRSSWNGALCLSGEDLAYCEMRPYFIVIPSRKRLLA